MLRLDVSAGAVEFMARMAGLAVARLRARYQRIAAELGGDGGAFAGTSAPGAAVLAAPEHAAPEYLRGLLCFREFRDHEQIAAVIGGAPLVEVPRGAVVVAAEEVPAVLLVVVRGAVDVSCAAAERRTACGSPARGASSDRWRLDSGPSTVVARTRERTVLIRLPGERAREMLREPSERRAAVLGGASRGWHARCSKPSDRWHGRSPLPAHGECAGAPTVPEPPRRPAQLLSAAIRQGDPHTDGRLNRRSLPPLVKSRPAHKSTRT